VAATIATLLAILGVPSTALAAGPLGGVEEVAGTATATVDQAEGAVTAPVDQAIGETAARGDAAVSAAGNTVDRVVRPPVDRTVDSQAIPIIRPADVPDAGRAAPPTPAPPERTSEPASTRSPAPSGARREPVPGGPQRAPDSPARAPATIAAPMEESASAATGHRGSPIPEPGRAPVPDPTPSGDATPGSTFFSLSAAA